MALDAAGLARLKALCQAAEHEDWATPVDTETRLASAARAALPALLAEVERLRAEDAASREQHAVELARRDAVVAALVAALEFYADPETYFAVGFFGDRPAGEFMEDFDDTGPELGSKPGKRARAALTLARGSCGLCSQEGIVVEPPND